MLPKPPFNYELSLERELEEFERLKPRLGEVWGMMTANEDQPSTSVVVPSLTLDSEELNTTIRDVAIIADEYDDRIAARYGGQTMQELLEESVIDHFRTAHGRDHFKS